MNDPSALTKKARTSVSFSPSPTAPSAFSFSSPSSSSSSSPPPSSFSFASPTSFSSSSSSSSAFSFASTPAVASPTASAFSSIAATPSTSSSSSSSSSFSSKQQQQQQQRPPPRPLDFDEDDDEVTGFSGGVSGDEVETESLLDSLSQLIRKHISVRVEEEAGGGGGGDNWLFPKKLIAYHRYLGLFVVGKRRSSPLTTNGGVGVRREGRGGEGGQVLFGIHCEKERADALDEKQLHEIVLKGASLDFEVERILINGGGTALCLLGVTRCLVVTISHRAKQQLRTHIEAKISCSASVIEMQSPLLESEVLCASWHPASDRHLALLTADNLWRLYDTSETRTAEQVVRVEPKRYSALGSSSSSTMVSFCFAHGALGWANLAVFFLSEDGDVYFLDPVVPYGCIVPEEGIRSMEEELEQQEGFDEIDEDEDEAQEGEYEENRSRRRSDFEEKPAGWDLARKWFCETFGDNEQRGLTSFSSRGFKGSRGVGSGNQPSGFFRAQPSRSFGGGAGGGRSRQVVLLQGPLGEESAINNGDTDARGDSPRRRLLPEGPSSLVCLPTEPLTLLRGWSSGVVDILFCVERISPRWTTSPSETNNGGGSYNREGELEGTLRMFERLDLSLAGNGTKNEKTRKGDGGENKAGLEMLIDPLQPENLYISHSSFPGIHCAVFRWLSSLRSGVLTTPLPSTDLFVFWTDPVSGGKNKSDLTPFIGHDFFGSKSGRFLLALGSNGELLALDVSRKWSSVVDAMNAAAGALAITASGSVVTSLSTLAEEIQEAHFPPPPLPLVSSATKAGGEVQSGFFKQLGGLLAEQEGSFQEVYTLVEQRVQLLAEVTSRDNEHVMRLQERMEEGQFNSERLEGRLSEVSNKSLLMRTRIQELLVRLNNLSDVPSDAELENHRFLKSKQPHVQRLQRDTDRILASFRHIFSPPPSSSPSTPPRRNGSGGGRETKLQQTASQLKDKRMVSTLKQALESQEEHIQESLDRVSSLENELATLSF